MSAPGPPEQRMIDDSTCLLDEGGHAGVPSSGWSWTLSDVHRGSNLGGQHGVTRAMSRHYRILGDAPGEPARVRRACIRDVAARRLGCSGSTARVGATRRDRVGGGGAFVLSGAEIAIGLIVCHFPGLGVEAGALRIDPVMLQALSVEIPYRRKSCCGINDVRTHARHAL